jgi:hypothetical protein
VRHGRADRDVRGAGGDHLADRRTFVDHRGDRRITRGGAETDREIAVVARSKPSAAAVTRR